MELGDRSRTRDDNVETTHRREVFGVAFATIVLLATISLLVLSPLVGS